MRNVLNKGGGRMSNTTLCIGGKNDIAVNVLEYILTHLPGVELFVIPDRNDKGVNTWQRSVKLYCLQKGIPLVSLDEIYDMDNLVFISTEFDRIIKPEKFKTSALYNIHFSMLPKYKGMFTSVLPILNGDTETGVTLHVIRSGIDTGEIIDQQKINIEYRWNSLDLYKELIKTGTKVVTKNLNRLIQRKYEAFPQPLNGSSYFGKGFIDYAALRINTKATAEQIRLQINAYAFRPYQLIAFHGVSLIGSMIKDDVSVYKPGTVIYEDEVEFRIATIDYDIILYKDVLDKLIEAIQKHENERAKGLCTFEKIVDEKEQHGWTPLTVAVYNNNHEMAKYLLSIGADERIVNNNGTTLLMYAKDAGLNTGDWDMFRWLFGLGLSIHEKDYSGRALIDYISNEEKMMIPQDIKDMVELPCL